MKKIFVFVLLLFVVGAVKAQTTNYQVYALFVMNIAKYSTWPANGSEFHIVVLGKTKVYDELAKQVAGKNINGLSVKVSQTDDVNQIESAQMVFLADNKSGSLSDLLKATEGKPIMVVAEREGLFKKGAGFSFVLMDNNTLRFDINNVELEKRNIKVSKNLSGLANSTI